MCFVSRIRCIESSLQTVPCCDYLRGIVTLNYNPIIAALDVPTAEQAWQLAAALAPSVGAFKIGGELFTAAGPDIVRRVRDTGAAVFLDLKFHDIPNTVAQSVANAVRLDVQMLTIHTSGGAEMMRAAEQSAGKTAEALGRPGPLVLGVTVLTSSDAGTLAEQVDRRDRGKVAVPAFLVDPARKALLDRLELQSPQRRGVLQQAADDRDRP